MATALASRAACARARPAPRAASRSAAQRFAPPPVRALSLRRASLTLRRAGGAPGEGSGVEEKWSPVASSDPLYDTSDELVAADDAAAGAGRAIMVTLDGGEASFRALDWALKNVARKKDTIHLVNVIPLDKTYSPYSFQPLNIVADPNLPQLDPELRTAAEERSKEVLRDGVAVVHATGRAAVAHLVVERTWESVSHAVCAKANELDAAALVVANSGKNWVRALATAASVTLRCRRRLMQQRFRSVQLYTFGRARPPLPPLRGLESVRGFSARR